MQDQTGSDRIKHDSASMPMMEARAKVPTPSTLQPQPVLMDRKPVTKVPTVASEKELQEILEARSNSIKQKKKTLDPRKARALRRKLYLDLYGEVAQRMLI